MKIIYSLLLVVSFGVTVYFIDTPNELLFNVLYANLLALMGVVSISYAIGQEYGMKLRRRTNETENTY